MLRIAARSLLFFAAASLLLGCGGGAEGGKQVPVYKVTGKVTMAGAALAGASVSFSPKSGQPVAFGTTNPAGEFTLTTYEAGDGAAPGDYAVVITKSKPAPAETPEEGHGTDPTKDNTPAAGHSAAADKGDSLIPEKYTDATQTPLAAKVEAKSDNNFTFEIK